MAQSGPIFVGGTGRSGTTITARLLGSHSRIHMIPIEVRFIVDPGGLCDLVAGKTDFGRFSERLRGRWWRAERPDGTTRGLHKILDTEAMEAALQNLKESPNAPESAGRFVHQMLDVVASASGASRWVEMTPANVLRGRELLAIFPNMKLVHVARDGRNVACSVSPLAWGPNDHFSALEWWAERMIQAHRACEGLSPDQLLEIRMEELTSASSNVVTLLFDFVGEAPDPSVLQFLENGISAERANVDRWRTEVDARVQLDFVNRYTQLVARLADEGLSTNEWGLP